MKPTLTEISGLLSDNLSKIIISSRIEQKYSRSMSMSTKMQMFEWRSGAHPRAQMMWSHPTTLTWSWSYETHGLSWKVMRRTLEGARKYCRISTGIWQKIYWIKSDLTTTDRQNSRAFKDADLAVSVGRRRGPGKALSLVSPLTSSFGVCMSNASFTKRIYNVLQVESSAVTALIFRHINQHDSPPEVRRISALVQDGYISIRVLQKYLHLCNKTLVVEP